MSHVPATAVFVDVLPYFASNAGLTTKQTSDISKFSPSQIYENNRDHLRTVYKWQSPPMD
jgi:uncharacterized BrkB/YihY/UPF0761 family membrane protein